MPISALGRRDVGYQLRRALRDALPPGLLTQGERAVLLELADFARDETRQAYPGMTELSRAVDMTAAGVTKCLQRMAQKGLELRVVRGTDAAGRPVYAFRGTQSTYVLPDPAELEKGGPPSTQSEKGWTTVLERVDHGPTKGGPPSTPSPQGTLKEPSSLSSAIVTSPPESERDPIPGDTAPQSQAERILARAGVPAAEILAVLDRLVRTHSIRYPDVWLGTAEANGTLPARIAEIHAPAPAVDGPRCDKHLAQIAGRCTGCAGDAKGAAVPEPSGPAMAREDALAAMRATTARAREKWRQVA